MLSTPLIQTTRMALSIFALLILAACSVNTPVTMSGSDLPIAWELTEGVKAPESAYLDPDSGFLFLSQIGDGGGLGKDGDGWISKLTVHGKVVKAKWATGLNAPKGLRSANGVLWVADIDRLIGFDIKTGTQKAAHQIQGAKFLNDVAAGPDGSIYVSDMLASAIYRLKDGKISVLAGGARIESPNGLLVDGNRLLIAAWGLDIQDNFTTKTPGRLLSLDLSTKKVTPITPTPTGNLDGLELDGHGGYVVTDWIAAKLFHISKNGKIKLIASFPKGAADHAYLPKRRLLILPQMRENKVTAYDLRKYIR